MKKTILMAVFWVFVTLSAVGQESETQPGNSEHNRTTVETNSTNTSIPAMKSTVPIVAPAIQFEGC